MDVAGVPVGISGDISATDALSGFVSKFGRIGGRLEVEGRNFSCARANSGFCAPCAATSVELTVTVPGCLLGSAFVATSLVKTSVTTSPRVLGSWISGQHVPGRSAGVGALRGKVLPVRELPPGYLLELSRVPHVEVPGQLLEEPDFCSAILRAASLLLLQLLDSLLQGLYHAPEDHVELLVVERHQLPAVQVLRLAHSLAQRGPRR